MNFYSFKLCVLALILASTSSISFALPFDMPLGAKLEYTQESDRNVHQVVLSAPKRISNALAIEKESLIKGIKTSYLFRINEPASSQQVFDQLLSQAKENGTIEYVCAERACGSSNYWANTILEERTLYGRDNNQHYFVSKSILDGHPHWQVVYAVKNGRKRDYVYVAVVEEEVEKFVWVNGLDVQSAVLANDVQQYIRTYLAAHPDHQLWIEASVASSAGDSFEVLKGQSDQDVVGFKQAFIKQNEIPEKNVKIYSAGPFDLNGTAVNGQTHYRLFLLAP